MTRELTSNEYRLVTDWFRRARENQRAHYAAANGFRSIHVWLGIPAIISSTVVGVAVFASLQVQPSVILKVIVGLISVAAAILTGLQTFLRHDEKSARHQHSAASYSQIRRSLELFVTFPPDDVERDLEFIRSRLDDLASLSPPVPPRVFSRIVNDLKNRTHERVFKLPGRSESTARNPELTTRVDTEGDIGGGEV